MTLKKHLCSAHKEVFDDNYGLLMSTLNELGIYLSNNDESEKENSKCH